MVAESCSVLKCEKEREMHTFANYLAIFNPEHLSRDEHVFNLFEEIRAQADH